jgi:hypothetical protein
MPRSRNRPKSKSAIPAGRRHRWDWRRVAGGIAEFLRNLALVVVGTPFVEPFLSGTPIDAVRALIGAAIGLAVLGMSFIIDHERSD